MSDVMSRLYKSGGISLIVSGSLFLVKSILEMLIGPPPSIGSEILTWIASKELLLAFTNEVLFFAVGFLVPAVIALHESLASTNRSQAAAGCGIMAMTIPVLMVLAIVHGRLMYPVYGIQVHTPEVAEFAVALYYGGLHAVAILFSIATFVVSLAMRRGAYGRNIANLGFTAAIFDLLSAYPEAIGPILGLVSSLLFTAWFFAVGVKLYRMPGQVLMVRNPAELATG